MLPVTEEEVAAWRLDTPGCASVVHLNNAGASLVPMPVHEAMVAHLERESQVGGYEAAALASADLERCYADLATLIGARAGEIAMVSSATAAFAQALSSFPFGGGDTIVTTNADYISNQLMFLSLAQRHGVRVIRAADDPSGGVDPDDVRRLIRRHRPTLVSLSWIPTNSGLIQPAADVGLICEEEGVPYLVDACQAVGQLPVDVARVRCDFLAATARKFLRGPRGIGFLYVSSRALARGAHPLLVDMRGAHWSAPDGFELAEGARRFEQWELPYALVLGMGAAARYALDAGIERTAMRAHALAASLRRALASREDLRVLDHGSRLGAIVTVATPRHDPFALLRALRADGFNTTAQGRDDAVIDMDRKGAPALLRISPHYFNTPHEIERFLATFSTLLDTGSLR